MVIEFKMFVDIIGRKIFSLLIVHICTESRKTIIPFFSHRRGSLVWGWKGLEGKNQNVSRKLAHTEEFYDECKNPFNVQCNWECNGEWDSGYNV